MRLDSVAELKRELLNELVAPLAQAQSLPARHQVAAGVDFHMSSLMAAPAQPVWELPRLSRTIALGVKPKARGYDLAVRVQHPRLLGSPFVEEIVRRARKEVDLRLIGRVEKRSTEEHRAIPWHRGKVRPLVLGASVSHKLVTAGTIGAFVSRDGRVCILSNNHVLANENNARGGDAVYQPGRGDGGGVRQRVASLHSWVRLSLRSTNLVDAALAEVGDYIEYEPALLKGVLRGRDRTLSGVEPAEVDGPERVYKIGRTTGATAGRIAAFDIDHVVVKYGMGNLRFDGIVEIEGTSRQPLFSSGGDSGALILNSKMAAIGLLFAGSEMGGARNMGVTYAIPLKRVLKEVGGTLVL